MNLGRVTLCAALLLGCAGPAAAQAVKLEFTGGLVNLTVQNAPARVVLAEWARLGGTQIVNGNNVTGAPMTLELNGVTEKYALEVILRNVPGYIVSARPSPGVGGASAFDRVMIMPTTRAVAPAGGATFGAPPQRPPTFDGDDAGDVTTIQRVQEQMRAADAARRAADEAAGRVVTGQPVTQQPNGPVVVRPGGAPQPFFPDPAPAAPPAAAAPGPGQTAPPPNPFAPTPVPAQTTPQR